MRQIMKFYGVPAVIAVMYSSTAAADLVPMPTDLPMAEGGLLAMLTLSVMVGIWLAGRKR